MNEPQKDAQSAEPAAPADSPVAQAAVQSSQPDLHRMETRIAELQDRMLRGQADLENFRRRVQREQDEARKYESLRLVRDLLPALDGLQRAIASAEQTGNFQNLLDGIRMVSQQFRDALRGHAAEPIKAEGQPFDPAEHEALTQLATAECPPMTVLQVVEEGYRMHDRVVRPSRVIVSCAPASDAGP